MDSAKADYYVVSKENLESQDMLDEIHQLFYRRIRYMDTRQWHLYADLHTPDAVSETYGPGTRIEGAEAIANAIQNLMEGPPPITSVHQGFHPEIEFTSEDTATGIWAMEDRLWWQNGDAEEWLHGYGHYHERYQRLGWKVVYQLPHLDPHSGR